MANGWGGKRANAGSGGARKGAGRKKKPEAERQTHIVWVRLSEPLYTIWQKLGKAKWLRGIFGEKLNGRLGGRPRKDGAEPQPPKPPILYMRATVSS
ncbi:MAG: hypothetical protein LBD99_04705 [Candidatus Margulisbacteria bacterium]|jgi:hypothetical protein|nr:hypothetical protein [Candidatus Margulisiibacteriota bacterium]